MRLCKEPYEMIKNRTKTIEIRLNDEKRQALSVGDIIEFTEINNADSKLLVTVTALYKYPDFFELYKHFDKISLGYTENEIADANDMYSYYSKENIKKFGALAIEVKLISKAVE